MSLLIEEIPMRPDDQLAAGARNLLLNCAGLKARDRLLIVHEDPSLGWYDKAAPLALGTEAEAMGIQQAPRRKRNLTLSFPSSGATRLPLLRKFEASPE